MKKNITAAVISLFMGFVGLIVVAFVDDVFGAAEFEFTPFVSLAFIIVTMGACIIYCNERIRNSNMS